MNNSDKTMYSDIQTQNNLIKRFQSLAASDLNSDCEFIVGPDQIVIKGHKIIFCTASDVFQAMFFGNLKEDSVRVEDLDPDGFRGMKTFIYTGEICFISVFHALETFLAARKYMFEDLTVVCAKFVESKIQTSEVLEFLDCCLTNEITEFHKLCFDMIVERTDEALANNYFKLASFQTIKFILKSPSLNLNSEIELYELFEQWAEAEVVRQNIPSDCVTTKFNNLKKHIRFLTISSDEIVDKIAPSKLLTQQEKLEIALHKMKFNPEMISNTISMTQDSRNFTKLPFFPNKFKRIFYREIEIDIKDRSDPQITLFLETNTQMTENPSCKQVLLLTIQWTVHDEYISCEAQPNTSLFLDGKIMVIKTENKVLTSDNPVFKNESKYIHRKINTTLPPENVVLAVIPRSIFEEDDSNTKDDDSNAENDDSNNADNDCNAEVDDSNNERHSNNDSNTEGDEHTNNIKCRFDIELIDL